MTDCLGFLSISINSVVPTFGALLNYVYTSLLVTGVLVTLFYANKNVKSRCMLFQFTL